MATQPELESKWQKRQQWFLDRIGKRVYRAPVSCQCDSCKKGHLEGIVIADEMHADYLHCCEAELRIRYTDNPMPI